jgi:hypothetical protein
MQVTPKGVDVISFADGKVIEILFNSESGWIIAVSHESKMLTVYKHLRDKSVVVKVGDTVRKGQKIGVMGNTGNCISSRTDIPPEYRGTHLHFEVKQNSTTRYNGDFVDPIPYLNGVKSIGSGSPSTANTTPAAASAKKSNDDIASEVIRGLWGNGQERKDRLAAAGYDYTAVQAVVNQRLK